MDKKERIAIPEYQCQTCGYKMDSTSGAFEVEARPKKDDLSVCLKCGTVSKFDANLNLIPLTLAELSDLKKSEPEVFLQLRKTQWAIEKLFTKKN